MGQKTSEILFMVECIVEPSIIALKNAVTVGKCYPVYVNMISAYIIVDDDNHQAMYVSSYFRKIEIPISYHPEQVSEQKNYFNTTNLPEVEVVKHEKKMGKQAKAVLEYMEKNHWEQMTSLDIVFNQVLGENVPETSVRRCLSTLHKIGKIDRVKWKDGQYGKRIGVYQVVSKPMPEIFF